MRRLQTYLTVMNLRHTTKLLALAAILSLSGTFTVPGGGGAVAWADDCPPGIEDCIKVVAPRLGDPHTMTLYRDDCLDAGLTMYACLNQFVRGCRQISGYGESIPARAPGPVNPMASCRQYANCRAGCTSFDGFECLSDETCDLVTWFRQDARVYACVALASAAASLGAAAACVAVAPATVGGGLVCTAVAGAAGGVILTAADMCSGGGGENE